MTCLEDNQYIEYLLKCLTPTQQKVIKLVMDGLSTPSAQRNSAKATKTYASTLRTAGTTSRRTRR